MSEQLPERVASKINFADEGCWEWMACKVNGYGRVGWLGRSVLAHRLVYILLTGHDPGRLDLDHLCRNRGCVNPAHLEAVTHRENILRGMAAEVRRSATHCKNGHERTPENIVVTKKGARVCRICLRRSQREYMRRKRAEWKATA